MAGTRAPASRTGTPAIVLAASLAGAGLGVAAHVLGKAVRDTMFLSTFPVEWLPYAFVATGLISGFAVNLYTRLTTRFSPRKVIPALGALCALAYPVFYLLVRDQAPWAVAALYAWVSVTGALLVSGFWSLLSERFEPRAARRLYGYIGVASTVGGLVAGLGAHQALSLTDPEGLLLPLGVVNLLLAVALYRLGEAGLRKSAQGERKAEESAGLSDGVKTLAQHSYLRDVALLTMAVTVAGTLGDYVLKDRAADALTDKHALAEFFSLFHGAVGAVTLGVQLLFARPLVAKKGLAAALVALPLWLFVGAVGVLAAPVLATATALRGGENSVRNSFHRSGYELLFIPLDARTKQVTKPILDTLVERIADAFGAVTILIFVSAVGIAAGYLAFVVAALAVLAMWFVARVRRGYVETLSSNLVARAVELDDLAAAVDDDATAREAIRTTLVDTNRAELRKHLEMSEVGASLMMSLNLEALPKGLSGLATRKRSSAKSTARSARPAATDPVLALMGQMLDPDPSKAKAAIGRWDHRDRRPVPILIRLLARQELHEDAISALSKAGDRIVGTLSDHLRDPGESFAVRRRIPRVLGSCRSDSAVKALMDALGDARFEVRYHAAVALTHIQKESPESKPPSEVIWKAIREEVKKSRPMWEAQRILDEPDDVDEAQVLGALQRRGAHSLHHVFRLLSLVLEPQPIELSFRAVQAEDPQFRGVGLEYLENVLPNDVRASLWPHIGDDDGPPSSRRGRSLSEVMAELHASGSTVLPAVDRKP